MKIGVPDLELGVREPLEDAETSFAQAGLADYFVFRFIGDASRGLVSAAQVTRVERRVRNGPQPPRHLPRLLQTERRERAVLLALHPALQVPHGFAVADEKDFGRHYG